MSSELIDFFNIIFRYIHVVAAIMWIGNSLLFTWMEINLLQRDDDDNLIGYMDMLHGGGVFHLQKRKLKPDTIPKPLHWFYWQSYTTWLSGFALLVTFFFTRADTLLLDASKADLPGYAAILISVGGIFGGWFLFDLYWRSPLKNYLVTGAIVWFAIVIGYAAALDTVFNGRAVFLQVGMTLGSFMTANVFFHIIPNQKKLMKALLAGEDHDLKVGKAAKFRSLSNHYITFPVIFLMLSAHFPVLYGSGHNVLILAVIIGSLILIKRMMNIRNTFKPWLAILFGTFITATAIIVAALNTKSSDAPQLDPVALEGQKVFSQIGCNACHQGANTSIAPNLQEIFGSTRTLADGTEVVADEAYLRESILESTSKIVAGYPPTMPPYKTIISDEQADQLIAFLKEY
ncbi:urate hydroxylase PuuD [Puniceicoccaceae bacterium K14]|nr:urate hydroxylase PuuD [Puniceicoccaceae bacterium K14]